MNGFVVSKRKGFLKAEVEALLGSACNRLLLPSLSSSFSSMDSQDCLPGPLLTYGPSLSPKPGQQLSLFWFLGNLPYAAHLLNLATEAPSHSPLAIVIHHFIKCCKLRLCLIYSCMSHSRVTPCSRKIMLTAWMSK